MRILSHYFVLDFIWSSLFQVTEQEVKLTRKVSLKHFKKSVAILWDQKEGKKSKSMLRKCLGNDCYYKQLLWFLKHCFYHCVFISSGNSLFYTKLPFPYTNVKVSVKFSIKPTKAFFDNRRMGNMFSFNSYSFDQFHQREREERKTLKDGHSFARGVWMLVSVWGSCSCLKTCMNMNNLWCIFHPKTERRAAVGYLYEAGVPLVHAHK